MDQSGQLDGAQVVETGNHVFVILLDDVELYGVGFCSIE
jgi:hypothetical protein